MDVKDHYHIEVSIDAELANDCKLDIAQTFGSIEEALAFLANGCGLEVKKLGSVYAFRRRAKPRANSPPVVEQPAEPKPDYLYQGVITDGSSNEPLPFAYIQLEGKGILSDENGRFSFKTKQTQEQLQLKYLGYTIEDTLLQHGQKLHLELAPKPMALNEVLIGSESTAYLVSLGEDVGRMKVNNLSTGLVPSNSNNLIFSHLRLYPGVMAAGESSTDYILWGAYPGQSQVLFDGITLFNSAGIHGDIGRITPLMVQDVEVHKGGYNVDLGDRAGGVMLIHGKDGNPEQFNAEANVSNEVASLYLNIPLFKQSTSLQIAGRKSYYHGLGWQNYLGENGERSGKHWDDNKLFPDYEYQDVNLKLTTNLRNEDKLTISGTYSYDDYSEWLEKEEEDEEEDEHREYTQRLQTNSSQVGASVQYVKNWTKGGISQFQVATSHYYTYWAFNFKFKDTIRDKHVRTYDDWMNPIREYSAKASHNFPAKGKHKFHASMSYVGNTHCLSVGNDSSWLSNTHDHVHRFSFYGKDAIQLSRRINIQLGLKADIPLNTPKIYLQPRINGSLQLGKYWKVNAGWGIYNQFISRTGVVDSSRNYSHIWQVSNGDDIPVLRSMHNVFEWAYLSPKFEWSVSGFYKFTDGMSRMYQHFDDGEEYQTAGQARTYGLDLYIKKRFGQHETWISYSFGKVTERFPEMTGMSYREAPHSQRHEIKTALVLNFHPFHLSFAHVYGSGFPNTPYLQDNSVITSELGDPHPYARLDFAFQYRKVFKRIKMETGLSVLNVYNHKNIRLNRTTNFPDGTTISTLGIPISPNIYINLRL